MGPLSGLRVIDASNFVFGPVASQMLGDMGADVIKIEPPEGDPTRKIGKSVSPLMGSFFLNLNRNKKSVVLDLKQRADLDALLALLASADVFIHNMRGSAIKRLGLDYRALQERFPRLVYAAALGFGEGGPYAGRPAYDDVIQGLSGLCGLNARMNGTPAFVPMLMTDKLCGVYLAFAVAAALTERERSGQGQQVQVPMFETMASFNLLDHMADGVFADDQAPLGYARTFGKYHRPLATADGSICLIANTDAQWTRLFELLDLPELAADARFADIGSRIRHIDALYQRVEEKLKGKTSAQWLALLEAADLPVGPANELNALREDPQLLQTGFFQELAHESEGRLSMPALPLDLSRTPGGLRLGPPRLGQHTQEILAEIKN